MLSIIQPQQLFIIKLTEQNTPGTSKQVRKSNHHYEVNKPMTPRAPQIGARFQNHQTRGSSKAQKTTATHLDIRPSRRRPARPWTCRCSSGGSRSPWRCC